MAQPSGGWYGYLDILREGADILRDERTRPPQACPDCGEPLTEGGPGGVLFCKFDGRRFNGVAFE